MNSGKKLLAGFFIIPAFFLVGCSSSDVPLTETQQAEKYGLTLEEYREQKQAAANMGMTIDEHLSSGHHNGH